LKFALLLASSIFIQILELCKIKKLINYFFDINLSNYTSYLDFIKEIIVSQNYYLKIKSNSFFFNFSHLHIFDLNTKNFTFKISTYPSKNLSEDFYLSNKMLKNSKTMQKLSQFYRKQKIYG
jgi:hypothetical protein